MKLEDLGTAQEGKGTVQEAFRVSDELEDMKEETHVRRKYLDKLNEEMKAEFSMVKQMIEEIREMVEELKHGEALRLQRCRGDERRNTREKEIPG